MSLLTFAFRRLINLTFALRRFIILTFVFWRFEMFTFALRCLIYRMGLTLSWVNTIFVFQICLPSFIFTFRCFFSYDKGINWKLRKYDKFISRLQALRVLSVISKPLRRCLLHGSRIWHLPDSLSTLLLRTRFLNWKFAPFHAGLLHFERAIAYTELLE